MIASPLTLRSKRAPNPKQPDAREVPDAGHRLPADWSRLAPVDQTDQPDDERERAAVQIRGSAPGRELPSR